MTVRFDADLPKGTEVRLFSNGLEGIIIDRYADSSSFVQYIVEMRHGDTMSVSPDELAPAEHPVHKLLDAWNKEGSDKGQEGLVIGMDKAGEWHGFFVGSTVTYGDLVRRNQHIDFMYYWRLRS